MRQGVPSAGNFLHQELAIITGAVEAMVVDVQCIMQALLDLAQNFHTKVITTSPKVKITRRDPHRVRRASRAGHRQGDRPSGDRQLPQPRRDQDPRLSPPTSSPASRTSTSTTCWAARYRASFRPLNDAIMSGRIRGVAAVVGCNNPRTTQDATHDYLVRELLKQDVLVVETGCGAIASGKYGYAAGRSGLRVGRAGPARSLRGHRHAAGAAHGLVRGQHPHPDRADADGGGGRAGRRHQRRARPSASRRSG